MWVGVVIREHVSPKRHAELVSASIVPHRPMFSADKWTLNQVQGDGRGATEKSSRRGAEIAEPHSPKRHAGAEGVRSTTRFSIHRAT